MSLLTRKQFAILNIIVEGNEAGADPLDVLVDLDQVIERIPYLTSKAAIQFSIRSMVEAGFIVKSKRQKRRGASRALYSATEIGSYRINPKTPSAAASYISEIDDILDVGDFHSEV